MIEGVGEDRFRDIGPEGGTRAVYAKSGSSGARVSERSPMQSFFIARLEHLVEQRDRYSTLVAPDDWRLKLIGRALYSAYRDLLELELADEAREILERGRASHRG